MWDELVVVNIRCCSGIFLEGLRNTTKPHKYEGVLTTRQLLSVFYILIFYTVSCDVASGILWGQFHRKRKGRNWETVPNQQTLSLKLWYPRIWCSVIQYHVSEHRRNRGSSVSTVSGYWTTGKSRFDPWQRQEVFPLTPVSRPELGPTKPPVQWVPEVLFPGVNGGRGISLINYHHLVPRSWMSRSYSFCPPCSSTGMLWDCFTFSFEDNPYDKARKDRISAW
jgi:hypothetical protein